MHKIISYTIIFILFFTLSTFSQNSSLIDPPPLTLDEIQVNEFKIGIRYDEQLAIKNFGKMTSKAERATDNVNEESTDFQIYFIDAYMDVKNSKVQAIGIISPKPKLPRGIGVGDNFFSLFKTYGNPKKMTIAQQDIETDILFKPETGFICQYSSKGNQGEVIIYFILDDNGIIQTIFIEGYGGIEI